MVSKLKAKGKNYIIIAPVNFLSHIYHTLHSTLQGSCNVPTRASSIPCSMLGTKRKLFNTFKKIGICVGINTKSVLIQLTESCLTVLKKLSQY